MLKSNPCPVAASPSSAGRLSKADRAYRLLRERIRELTLYPGARLDLANIAQSLGVSRGSVARAIARLADETLVEVFPQHGSYVAPIRPSDMRESLFIRSALEIEGARRAASAASPALIARLNVNLALQRAALQERDYKRFYDLDEALHSAIFRSLGLPRSLKALDAARAPLDRPRRLALPDPRRAWATYSEHRLVVDAIASRDPEFAATAMRAHFTQAAAGMELSLARLDTDVSSEQHA